MGATQQFSLRWNNYVQHITSAFDNLRSDEDLVDVTLSCEGKKIYAHKMLLSACSNYFKEVFKDNPCKHPVIIFRNVNFEDLVAIIDFMYHGEVNVEQDQLSSFLTTAEMLAVQGLSVGSTSKDELRKRQPVFVDTTAPLASTLHDGSEMKQSSKLLSRPLGTQNPPGPAVLPSRPITPTGRKRRLSPTGKPSIYKESFCKKKSRNVNPVKVESDDVEDDNSFEEEEDGMIDVSQLEVPLDEPECEPPVVKMEAPPSPDANEKALPRDDLAGPQSKVGQAGGGSGGGSETAGGGKSRASFQKWVCEICGKSFKHKDSRRQHYKSHEGSTECPICHNVLSRKYELKVHMRKRHSIDLLPLSYSLLKQPQSEHDHYVHPQVPEKNGSVPQTASSIEMVQF